MDKKVNLKLLIFHVMTPLFASGLIYFLIPNANNYFQALVKPFPVSTVAVIIIWSLLYVVAGYAAYLVDNKPHNGELVMRTYYVQLLVNLFFLPIFLGVQNLIFASIWNGLLLILVLIITYLFYKEKRLSGRLLLPYCLWCVIEIYFMTMLAILN